MDNCYDRWQQHNRDIKDGGLKWSYNDFIDQLTPYEKTAVILGNLNYQVENGGFMQWDDNGYSDYYDDIYDFIESTDFVDKDKLIDLVDEFQSIKDSIDKLDSYDDFYTEDCETRYRSMNNLDSRYYDIEDSWKDYVNEYLLDNVPQEYIDCTYDDIKI